MRNNRTGIILLAAGASTRMGSAKQLIKIGGTSMIRRAVQTAIGTGCQPVVVVTGAGSELVSGELEGLDVTIALNSQWQTGMSASIRAGLDTLLGKAPEIDGVLLMVADQPCLTAESLGKILAGPVQSQAKLVAARFKDTWGTPAWFARDYFEELKGLAGPAGAKSLLERHRGQVLAVDLPEAALDLDTPEDVAALARHLAEAGRKPAIVPQTSGLSMAPAEPDSPWSGGQTRRQFITNVTVAGVGIAAAPPFFQSAAAAGPSAAPLPPAEVQTVPVKLKVNGTEQTLKLDPRVTLLDALRERMGLTGSKKGCDHGQCGACTVLVNGRRINSCLALAVVHDGDEITTIEGLAKGAELHPMQTAFLEHDGFQCGYCTPGQICSAVALLKEGHANTDAEIREWMSGNICRCGAYSNIVAAIQDAKSKTAGAI